MRWTDSAIDLAVDFGKAQLPPGYFHKFIPFVKAVENEDGRHMVYGLSTAEELDKDNEICDYGETAPEYRKWSDAILKATTGAGQEPSLGNIRIQHGLEVGGKVVKMDFVPEKQQIWIGTEPINEEVWDQIRRGFFVGFSQGGKYKMRRCNICKTSIGEGHYCTKCRKDVTVRYAAKIAEVSYVDNPCLASATYSFVKDLLADKKFTYVGANGSTELRKFVLGKKGPMDSDPGQRQDQEALPNPEPGMPSNNGQADPPAREIKCGKCGGAMKCASCGCGMPEAAHPASKLVLVMEEAVIKLTPRHSSGRFTNRASGEAHDQLTAAGYDHVGTGSETPYAANGAEESPSPTRRYKNTKTGRTVTLHDDGRWNSDNGHGTTVSGRGIDTMVSHVQSFTKKAETDELNKGIKYLVTEPDGTTHLPYTDSAGNPDHNLMGAAYAALTSSHRGQPYAGPDKEKALAHLKHVYESESMDLPGKTTLIDILQDAEQQLAKAS